MSDPADLRALLAPLAEHDGVVVVLLLTRDGLPVEMVGHGMRAEVLAAEAASLIESARSAGERLMLGEAEDVTVSAPGYQLRCLPMPEHALALVVTGASETALAAARAALGPLRQALGEGG